MANRKTAQPVKIRKKSVSKASAAKGREDSRAAQIKNEKNARISSAQKDPKKLAEVYKEREHDVDQQRKVHRRQKPKKKER
jgi:hypothetical protein